MSLILAGLVFAGTSGALFVGRWIAKRRAAAALEAGADPNADKKELPPKKEEEEDEDEARGRAEAEAEAPTRKDDSDPNAASTGDEKSKVPSPPDAKTKQPARTNENSNAAKRKGRAPERDATKIPGFVCQLGDVLMRLTGEEAWLAGGLVLSEEIPVAVLFVAPDAGHDCAIYVRARPRDSLMWLEPLDPSAILVGGEPPSSVEHGGIRFDRARRLPLRPRRIGVGAPDVGDAVVVAEYSSAGAERLLVIKANTGDVRAYRGLELEEGSFEVIASGESTLES